MPLSVFNEEAEVLGRASIRVRPFNHVHTFLNLWDGAAHVFGPEVQVQRPRRNESGNIRYIAVLVKARDEGGVRVQVVCSVNG